MTRQINAAALALIESFEQLRLVGYLPTPNDKPTGGWGHTGPDVKVGVAYTRGQAVAWLSSDLEVAEAEVDRACPHLTDNEFGACVSFTFNEGVGGFEHSTLHRLIDAGDMAGAADEFPKWDKQAGTVLEGLVRRRAAERALFLTPEDNSGA